MCVCVCVYVCISESKALRHRPKWYSFKSIDF